MNKIEINPKLSDGITQRGLETFRKIAKNPIKRGGDKMAFKKEELDL